MKQLLQRITASFYSGTGVNSGNGRMLQTAASQRALNETPLASENPLRTMSLAELAATDSEPDSDEDQIYQSRDAAKATAGEGEPQLRHSHQKLHRKPCFFTPAERRGLSSWIQYRDAKGS